MSREFPTLAVLGVYTGIVLEDGGFAGIHEVLDHLYPGITTIGCAVMAEQAQAELLRQHPEFADIPYIKTFSSCKGYTRDALARFGPTLSVIGPVGAGGVA